MKIIMKISSLIIVLLLTISNVIAQQCDWTATIDGIENPPACPATAPMCVEYDESLATYYGMDECENVCFTATVNTTIPTTLYISSSNGYYIDRANVTTLSAVVCFGQASGDPVAVPFRSEETITGGLRFGRADANVCTVMIEGP